MTQGNEKLTRKLTPAEADAELLARAGDLTDDETERFAAGELQPGWQFAEDVNREMQRVQARREERERVAGEPAVLSSTTGGGRPRHRDGHGNVRPLPRNPERERMLAEWERFSRLSRPQQQLYQAVGAVHERRARRTPPSRRPRPRPRPRARRPAARRALRRTSGQDPPGESESDPEPAVELPSGWTTLPPEPGWEAIRKESDRRNDEEYERLVARVRAEAEVR